MANTGQFRSESEFYDLDVSGDEGSEALVRYCTCDTCF